jgi:sugar lactone lactonase YvrE
MKQVILALLFVYFAAPAFAQQVPAAPGLQNAPEIPFESVPFLKLTPERNLGEVLSVAVNSKGHVVVLNHPGSAGTGPVYGESTTQLLEFDEKGNFVREIGRGVYGLAYSHSVRFDKYDNLWVVDKAAMSVMKFDPAGMVLMNLGRRDEGPDEPRYRHANPPPTPADALFNGSTDVAWDAQDNIYVGDGYFNSRIAKFDKDGNWIKQWGEPGSGGVHANENPGHISNPHNIGIDRQQNVYVADRGNRRIQVFDTDGNFKKFIFLTVPYDKTRHPVLGNMPANRPDETQPWTICITNTPTQYLYTSDSEPGRIYKLSLPDGKILGVLGKSGHVLGQFNWVHGLACPDENTLYVADMNNWRVQKLILHPDKQKQIISNK